MSAHCCGDVACSSASADLRFRNALWVALVLNALMFVVELGASWTSGSVSLLADSIDFFGDAANYTISLVVLGMGLATRARAALFKAACMGAFGVFVLGKALWTLMSGTCPIPRRWARWALPRWPSTLASRGCCIGSARATPTCARCGSARATMRSATWP